MARFEEKSDSMEFDIEKNKNVSIFFILGNDSVVLIM